MFKIIKKDSSSWMRTGILETAHGLIETPAYVVVGTHGRVKCLASEQLRETKTQAIIANTYHLWQNHREPDGQLDTLPKVHELLGTNLPIMTDSGGFQVFSLGSSREHGVGKVANIFPSYAEALKGRPEHQIAFKRQFSPEENLVRITEEGVFFSTAENGEQPRHPERSGPRLQTSGFLGPELSIKIQEALGADIILAFDECTSPLHDYEYTKAALERTHRWAGQCLLAKTRTDQMLYGIVQGGEFEDLRKASAVFINSLPFDGFAIGGSLGRSRNNAFEVLRWTIPLLNQEKPRHFLGMGKIEDLFDGVEQGIDTFDCVIPTREARHARIWANEGAYDITKPCFKDNLNPLARECFCSACRVVNRSQLRQLFKEKNQLAGQYATIHNVSFFNGLMAKIRQAIKDNRFTDLKRKYLSKTKTL